MVSEIWKPSYNFFPYFLMISSVAIGSHSLLNLAVTSTYTLNFEIPSIAIKLDRDNYVLWRTTIISDLEIFDLEDFILHPNPPPTTIDVSVVATFPTTIGAPVVIATPTTTTPNPEYAYSQKRDRFVLLWLKSSLFNRALALVTLSTSSQMAW